MVKPNKSKKSKQDAENVETEAANVSDTAANGITDAAAKKRGKLDTKSEDKNGQLETIEVGTLIGLTSKSLLLLQFFLSPNICLYFSKIFLDF